MNRPRVPRFLVGCTRSLPLVLAAGSLGSLPIACAESAAPVASYARQASSPAPPASSAPATDGAAPPLDSAKDDAEAGALPPSSTSSKGPDDDRFSAFLPDDDEPNGVEVRVRRRTAVVLVAPPIRLAPDGATSYVPRARFQPLLCTIDGIVRTGVRCGEVMPPRTTIRSTSAGEIEVERTKTSTVFGDDGARMKPPYAPSCCMYNGCFGRTIPYFMVGVGDEGFYTNRKTLIGVWPKDADVGLVSAAAGVSEGVNLSDGLWLASTSSDRDLPDKPFQAFARGPRRYASLVKYPMDGAVFADAGAGWNPILRVFAPTFVLATTDVDGDGKPELFVYEAWVNDYGMDVFVDDATSPALHFNCGNI